VSFESARRARERRQGPLRLGFERRDWTTESESGGRLDGRGYVLLDGERSISRSDPRLAGKGIEVVAVAGTSYRAGELQDDGFLPGSPLALRAEPDNPHDPNAVGVWNASERSQAGYVPRDRAAALASRVDELEAYALWEWRDPAGSRAGLRILVAPRGTVSGRLRPPRA